MCGDGHAAMSGTKDEIDGGLHGDCVAQPCCYLVQTGEECKHPCCDCFEEEEEQVYELIAAVSAQRWFEVERAIRREGGRVTVNVERSAIQFQSACADRISAHIPVPAQQVATLARIERRAAMIRGFWAFAGG